MKHYHIIPIIICNGISLYFLQGKRSGNKIFIIINIIKVLPNRWVCGRDVLLLADFRFIFWTSIRKQKRFLILSTTTIVLLDLLSWKLYLDFVHALQVLSCLIQKFTHLSKIIINWLLLISFFLSKFLLWQLISHLFLFINLRIYLLNLRLIE